MQARAAVAKGRKFSVPAEEEEGDDILKCSGKSCSSCSGILLADCIALSCCPCAIISLLGLVFLKVPWVVGRKCLRSVLRSSRSSDDDDDAAAGDERSGRKGAAAVSTEIIIIIGGGADQELEKMQREGGEYQVGANLSGMQGEGDGGGHGSSITGLEVDEQLGQWGFGRVS